jgi:hypothetical protein
MVWTVLNWQTIVSSDRLLLLLLFFFVCVCVLRVLNRPVLGPEAYLDGHPVIQDVSFLCGFSVPKIGFTDGNILVYVF